MSLLFVLIACISLLCSVTAVLQVRRIGWSVWLWFFSGWVTGELAIWLIGSQMAFCCTLRAAGSAPTRRALRLDCPAFWRPGVCWRGPSGTALMPGRLFIGRCGLRWAQIFESHPGDQAGQADRADS